MQQKCDATAPPISVAWAEGNEKRTDEQTQNGETGFLNGEQIKSDRRHRRTTHNLPNLRTRKTRLHPPSFLFCAAEIASFCCLSDLGNERDRELSLSPSHHYKQASSCVRRNPSLFFSSLSYLPLSASPPLPSTPLRKRLFSCFHSWPLPPPQK